MIILILKTKPLLTHRCQITGQVRLLLECTPHLGKTQNRELRLIILQMAYSVAVLAEVSLSSPRKILIFIIKKYINRIKVSKK